MKVVTNTKLIQRNRKIGQILTLVALVILGIGLYISFTPAYLQFSLLALIIGFLVSQIGIYFGNRWGRSPRPDEALTSALKGLNDQYTLYHYTAPVSHLLVGPSGVWVLMPYSQGGTITFDKGRWRQKGGGIRQVYMKLFAQEGLGRPDLEVKAETTDMQRWLSKEMGEETPPVNAVLIFTNPKAEVKAENAPIPTLDISKLKEFIRRRVKETAKVVTPETIKEITSALPQAEEEA